METPYAVFVGLTPCDSPEQTGLRWEYLGVGPGPAWGCLLEEGAPEL